MKSINIIVLLVLVSFISACNKKNYVSDSERAEALLGQWEYTAIESDRAVDINEDGTVNIDLYNTQEIRQCIKDNLTFFTEMTIEGEGDYSINENGLACDDNDPFSTIENDSYKLIDNRTIRFDNRNDMRIIELTKSRLVIETNDILGNEDVIVTISYKKN